MEPGYYWWKANYGNGPWQVVWVTKTHVHFFGQTSQLRDNEFMAKYSVWGPKIEGYNA